MKMKSSIIIKFTISYLPGEDKVIIQTNTRHNDMEYEKVLNFKELPKIFEQYINQDM